MRDETRHLHELGRGDFFRFESSEDETTVWFLVFTPGRARCTINRRFKGVEHPTTSFTTGEGVEVSFPAGPQTSQVPCSGYAQVIPHV